MLIQFLIVCPLVFVAGLIDAVAGGGGLISLPAYMIAGVPVHYAIGSNKLSSGMGTAVATARFAKNGYIQWKRALACAVFALAGSFSGARLGLALGESVMTWLMLVILPLTALYILRGKALGEEKEALPAGKTWLICFLIAFGVGVYDGFYGPGTGTFLILLLAGLARLRVTEANGTAKVINLTTNITGLTVYLMSGKVLILLGLCAGICSIFGNYIGTRVFEKGGTRAVKPVMILVIGIFMVRTVWTLMH